MIILTILFLFNRWYCLYVALSASVFSFDSNHVSWGVSSLISQEMLKQKFIVNDKAVFCAEITGVIPLFLNVIINTFSPTMGTAERVKLMKVPRNNSRFTWKITQFSSFSGESHSSYEFTCGPRRWYAQFYAPSISVYYIFRLNTRKSKEISIPLMFQITTILERY